MVDNPEVSFVPVTARHSNIDREAWWDPELSLDYGSGPLMYRCMREYYWSKEYAERVLKGYRQFLELKKILEDWDAKILAPSIPVNMMWAQHLLDVTNYCHDTFLVCGRVVGNDPDGKLDEWANEKRITATKQLLRARFERQVDLEVWSFSQPGENRTGEPPTKNLPALNMSGLTGDDAYVDSRKLSKSSQSLHSKSHVSGKERKYNQKSEKIQEKRDGDEDTARTSTSSKRAGKRDGGVYIHESPEVDKEIEVEKNGEFSIRVRTLKGSIYTLQVSPSMKIVDVKTMIQQQHGIPEDKQHLLFYGKVLEDKKTLGDCSIPPDSGLQLLVRSRRPLDMSTAF